MAEAEMPSNIKSFDEFELRFAPHFRYKNCLMITLEKRAFHFGIGATNASPIFFCAVGIIFPQLYHSDISTNLCSILCKSSGRMAC
jgi:hypothetical protein